MSGKPERAMSETVTDTAPPTIRATVFSFADDCWKYALSNGSVVKAWPGDARIPCGMPYTERSQWGANQVFRRWP